MAYNLKAYSAALNFLPGGDDNIVNDWDRKRVQSYDLYENLYINNSSLSITLRGDDQHPILMPSGRKIVEATNRFLAKNLNYLVEGVGDANAQANLELWWQDFFKRETVRTKFNSSKRWGLVRGDGLLYVSADPNKRAGSRISLHEIDPRQVFEIDDPNNGDRILGLHIVEMVTDFRDKEGKKQIVKRRTFRRTFDELTGEATGVTSELTFWERKKWDDRGIEPDTERVPSAEFDEEEAPLPYPITQLPVYKFRIRPLQNCSWGQSILTGMETLMYGINQSISDEDATIVFQGLGMYVTNAGPPQNEDGTVGEWNIGPMQIIEINTDQTFERVTGVSDISPFTAHIDTLDEKGLSEGGGVPEIAIGRVDVAVAESGISLQLQLMPLLSSNAEIEEEMLIEIDRMFHDITTQWLPAYETETFGGGAPDGGFGEATEDAVAAMAEMSVVCIFDDPMPKNRDAEIQETILLDSSNLILKTMTIAKLRELGWKYPTVDAMGEPITDDMIAQMLLDQSTAANAALDPYGASFADTGGDAGTEEDAPPDETSVDLGTT